MYVFVSSSGSESLNVWRDDRTVDKVLVSPCLIFISWRKRISGQLWRDRNALREVSFGNGCLSWLVELGFDGLKNVVILAGEGRNGSIPLMFHEKRRIVLRGGSGLVELSAWPWSGEWCQFPSLQRRRAYVFFVSSHFMLLQFLFRLLLQCPPVSCPKLIRTTLPVVNGNYDVMSGLSPPQNENVPVFLCLDNPRRSFSNTVIICAVHNRSKGGPTVSTTNAV